MSFVRGVHVLSKRRSLPLGVRGLSHAPLSQPASLPEVSSVDEAVRPKVEGPRGFVWQAKREARMLVQDPRWARLLEASPVEAEDYEDALAEPVPMPPLPGVANSPRPFYLGRLAEAMEDEEEGPEGTSMAFHDRHDYRQSFLQSLQRLARGKSTSPNGFVPPSRQELEALRAELRSQWGNGHYFFERPLAIACLRAGQLDLAEEVLLEGLVNATNHLASQLAQVGVSHAADLHEEHPEPLRARKQEALALLRADCDAFYRKTTSAFVVAKAWPSLERVFLALKARQVKLSTVAQATLLRSLVVQHKFSAAVQLSEEFERLGWPTSGLVHDRRAQALIGLGRVEDATAMLRRKAVLGFPTSRESVFALMSALEERGASDNFERQVLVDAQFQHLRADIQVLNRIMVARSRRGDVKGARRVLAFVDLPKEGDVFYPVLQETLPPLDEHCVKPAPDQGTIAACMSLLTGMGQEDRAVALFLWATPAKARWTERLFAELLRAGSRSEWIDQVKEALFFTPRGRSHLFVLPPPISRTSRVAVTPLHLDIILRIEAERHGLDAAVRLCSRLASSGKRLSHWPLSVNMWQVFVDFFERRGTTQDQFRRLLNVLDVGAEPSVRLKALLEKSWRSAIHRKGSSKPSSLNPTLTAKLDEAAGAAAASGQSLDLETLRKVLRFDTAAMSGQEKWAELHRWMDRHHAPVDFELVYPIVQTFVEQDDCPGALDTIRRAERLGLQPNVMLYSVVARGFACNGDEGGLRSVDRELRSRGLAFDLGYHVLRATFHARRGDVNATMAAIHTGVTDLGLPAAPLPAPFASILYTAHRRAGDRLGAEQMLSQQLDAGLVPHEVLEAQVKKGDDAWVLRRSEEVMRHFAGRRAKAKAIRQQVENLRSAEERDLIEQNRARVLGAARQRPPVGRQLSELASAAAKGNREGLRVL